MRRVIPAAMLVAVVLTGSLAFSQARGSAPSVTSQGFGNHSKTSVAPMGPAPSVTSLGPRGYGTHPCISSPGATLLIPAAMGCPNPDARIPNNGFHRRPRGGYYQGYPAYVPYYPNSYYPNSYDSSYDQPQQAQQQQQQEQPDAEAPAPTIFENRPLARGYSNDSSRYGDHYMDARERQPADVPPPSGPATTPGARQDGTPIVLVFRDGHLQTVMNYAIVGQTLYDLNGSYGKKIPLAQLDLPATVKANEDQGVEFNLPSSVANN